MGWITKENVRDALVEKIEKMVRWEKRIDRLEERWPGKPKVVKIIEKIELKIDKLLARQFPAFLEEKLQKKVINQQTFNILNEDIEWLINNV